MRKLRTYDSLRAAGWDRNRVRAALKSGEIVRVIHGVYGAGPGRPTELDRVRATALITDGVLDAVATAHLFGFDGVERWWPRVLVDGKSSGKRSATRRVSQLPANEERHQVRCLSVADALRELASILDDIHWEQALEFCLRRRLVAIDEISEWQHSRVRRVLNLRGGLLVPPTESLLETLVVQLIRQNPEIPTPTRQLSIYDENGSFVGRPDLCWPELGIFLELDGQQHKDQPVYDAVRQTNITIATGWRPGRLTWDEVHEWPETTLRRLANLVRRLSTVS